MKKQLLTTIFLFTLLIPTAYAAEVPRDFLWEISKGNIPGHSLFAIEGIDENIGTTEYVLWAEGIEFVYPAAATLMNVSSTSAQDNPAGTGAFNVTVFGLDANYVEVIETVVLNGLTPVETTNQFFRVNMMRIGRTGAAEVNVGEIYIGTGPTVGGEPTVIYNEIEEENGASTTATYTVPDGHTAFLHYFTMGTDTTKIIETRIRRRCLVCPDNGWVTDFHTHFSEATIVLEAPAPLPYPEHTDIEVRGRNSPGSAFCSVDAFFILINNSVIGNSTLSWENGDPSMTIIQEPLDVNIVESIDLMSTEFFAFIILAAATMYFAWGTQENRKAGLGFAFSGLWWIAVMIQWVADHAGTTQIGIVWLFIAPLTFCFVMFMEKSWGQMDDATKTITERKNTF